MKYLEKFFLIINIAFVIVLSYCVIIQSDELKHKTKEIIKKQQIIDSLVKSDDRTSVMPH